MNLVGQATLKNLMQLRKQTFRKSHRSYYSQLPRIASFIGTSNQKELLTATEIFCRLQKKFPAALRRSNASQIGKMLQALGVQRTHTR